MCFQIQNVALDLLLFLLPAPCLLKDLATFNFRGVLEPKDLVLLVLLLLLDQAVDAEHL